MSHRSVSPTSDYTPDIHWGYRWGVGVGHAPIAVRTPRPHRIRRALRRLSAHWRLWLMAVGALIGAAIVPAPPAQADPISVEAATYAATHQASICSVIGIYPNVETVEDVVIAVINDGLTPRDAGQAVARGVMSQCPDFGYLLDAYIQKWAPAPDSGVQVAGGVGGALR